MMCPPRSSTLFPYTTLFRSGVLDVDGVVELERGLAVRQGALAHVGAILEQQDRKSTRLNSSHVSISYAVFCLKKKTVARAATWARSSPRCLWSSTNTSCRFV